jgi:DNA helicase-2/ATP-dependent DNA helicase PcrA
VSTLSRQSDERILAALNPEQREAVLHEEGPLLVLAGAGSGKTRVLTHRIARLVERGAPADGILAITFTNKAAGEMQMRTQALCGLKSPWISTFHSFSARVLRRHIHRLTPYDNHFSIYDQEDSLALIKEVLRDLGVEKEVWTPQEARAEISRLKNTAGGDIESRFGAGFVHGQALRSVYHAYSSRLRERNAVDFDDLLLLTVSLFEEHPDVLERYQEQFAHILVDEYQDTNSVQYRITWLLAAKRRNLCITGDPDQSIYRWRGADINNILNFEHDYPDARVVRLEQNYRSTKSILSVANALIAHNELRKPKELWTENPQGEPVRIYLFPDEREEAREITVLIEELAAKGTPLGGIAVFYRINSLSRAIEEELIYANIPYTIVGGIEFFQRQEVKDLLAYLQVLDNPRDAESLRRILNVPARQLGPASVEKLAEEARAQGSSLLDAVLHHAGAAGLQKRALTGAKRFAEVHEALAAHKEGPVGVLLERVVALTGYARHLERRHAGEDDRLANVGELISAGKEYDRAHPEGGLTGFLETVRLLTSFDCWEERADRVTLMTLHAAKGLEFPVVVIAGVEEGLLPLLRAADPDPDIEEERRLLYVGITRARERLYLTHAALRARFGERHHSTPSRFIAEVCSRAGPEAGGEGDALEVDDETSASLAGAARVVVEEDFWDRAGDEDWDLDDEDPYPLGSRVYHEEYGEGEVTRLTGRGRHRRVTVAFERAGSKQFVASHARLERRR